MAPTRIYLDNAATSWPKPDSVYQAVDHALRELGSPAGRSAYREASEVDRLVFDTRRRVAGLLGVDDPCRIIFTCNGTDSLNIALHGLLRPGDHVVTTVLEHNSVLRPLRFLETHAGLKVTRVRCDSQGVVDPEDIEAAVVSDTKLIALIHVSNVTGAIQPAVEVGRIAREQGVQYLLDAAQSLGHLPLGVADLGCSLLAAPAHKGLLGPLGLGLLYIAPGLEGMLTPLRQGGTGTQSETDTQPDSLPDKFECGNHNVPAILGLRAALQFIEQRRVEQIRSHEQALTAALLDGLSSFDGVRTYGPRDAERQLGVVSFTVAGYDPREVASMLDTAYAIQTRSGFHCAPLMHGQLGTADSGGTVRCSMGAFNTLDETDSAISAVGEIAGSAG